MFRSANSLYFLSFVYSYANHNIPVQNPSVHSMLSMIGYFKPLVHEYGNRSLKYSIFKSTCFKHSSNAFVSSSFVRAGVAKNSCSLVIGSIFTERTILSITSSKKVNWFTRQHHYYISKIDCQHILFNN